ncbi:hypothetical protein EJ05DRAFT_60277 [Pseudovirgaria hyperparasitica]|uniref:Zn(2)-C6 fungal-type domain-containing protein n=1 Tax=Pseudovirgaria hyperparasitica TaxID=470096 RepID=A0A6A6W5L8_9PEZI|nr:uncharacterized protein EJ05DRAFT_60277 [Pseudovirgaria hyperparasitica]KAF2757246.1 hypothetical protein EJ05DRAFT_60277 [Pseudovirgaria hyperparasitica]
MVGVPGRSRGCRTCRRRKLKCDEAKPTCERCPKAGLQCDGYDEVAWSVTSVSKSGRLTRLDVPGRASCTRDATSRAGEEVGGGGGGGARRQSGVWMPLMQLSCLGTEASREHDLVRFAAQRIFPWPLLSTTPRSRSWIFDLLEMAPVQAVLPAVCCLSATFISREEQQRSCKAPSDLTLSAMHYYRTALHGLSSVLQDQHHWQEPGTLGIVFMLSIYELINVRGGSGWMRHAGGISTLVRTIGPKTFEQEPGRSYLNLLRQSIVARAAERRERCFLEGPEWRSTSVFSDQDPDHLYYALMDAFAKIPGILEDADALARIEDEKSACEHGEQLRQSIVRALAALFRWRLGFDHVLSRMARAVPVDPSKSMTLDAHGRPLYPSILMFENVLNGRAVVMYDVLVLLLMQLGESWGQYDVAAKACDSLGIGDQFDIGLESEPAVLRLPSQDISPAEVMTETCRSIEFHLRGGSIYSGALMILYPFRILIKLSIDSETRAWLRRISHMLSEQHGLKCFAEIWDEWDG